MKKILLILLTFIYSFSVELTTKVLEPNEAFKTSFTKNQDSLTLKLELGKDIYLYDDKLKILIKKPQEIEITKEINIPKAVAYEEYIVHFDNLNLTIPFDLLKSKIDSKEFEIEVKFQGCSKLGLCYAPISEKYLLIIDEKIENSINCRNFVSLISIMHQANFTHLQPPLPFQPFAHEEQRADITRFVEVRVFQQIHHMRQRPAHLW